MKTYFLATFSDGTVLKRQTTSRKYTHAWLVRRSTKPEHVEKYGASYDISGFCGTQANAQATLNRYSMPTDLFGEIAPAVEVTRAQYNTGKHAGQCVTAVRA